MYNEESGKWPSLLNIQGTMTKHHAEVAEEVFQYIQEHEISKEDLIKMRNDTISKFPASSHIG